MQYGGVLSCVCHTKQTPKWNVSDSDYFFWNVSDCSYLECNGSKYMKYFIPLSANGTVEYPWFIKVSNASIAWIHFCLDPKSESVHMGILLVYMPSCQGVMPGCLLRGGGGGGQNVSLLMSEAKLFAPALKKSLGGGGGGGGGGGLPHIFFFRLQKNFNKNFHNGVGVASSCPWLTAELTSQNKTKQITGGAIAPPPPPPPATACHSKYR